MIVWETNEDLGKMMYNPPLCYRDHDSSYSTQNMPDEGNLPAVCIREMIQWQKKRGPIVKNSTKTN